MTQKPHRGWVLARPIVDPPPLTPSEAWRELLAATIETREARRLIFTAVLDGWDAAHRSAQ